MFYKLRIYCDSDIRTLKYIIVLYTTELRLYYKAEIFFSVLVYLYL